MTLENWKYGIIALGLACISLTLVAASVAQSAEPVNKMQLQGIGQVTAEPDIAFVSATIVETGKTAAQALKMNSNKLNAVFDLLKAKGIEEKDIQTDGLRMSPVFDRPKNRQQAPKIIGYQVYNGFDVKISNIDTTGEILDAIVNAGINQIGQIRFTISDMKPLMNEARILATQNAIEKAELYSDSGGFELGDIISFSEHGNRSPQPRAMMEMAKSSALVADAPTPIAGGELSITATVSITWEIE